MQWMNLNWNNRSVLVHWYSVLWEKTGPILPLLVDLMAGRRQTGRWNVSGFWSFYILYRLNYSGFYFVYYHYNVTTVLELHFSRLLSSKVYFKVFLSVKNLVAIFFMSIPTSYVPNDNVTYIKQLYHQSTKQKNCFTSK